jgi:hypothetical protein
MAFLSTLSRRRFSFSTRAETAGLGAGIITNLKASFLLAGGSGAADLLASAIKEGRISETPDNSLSGMLLEWRKLSALLSPREALTALAIKPV